MTGVQTCALPISGGTALVIVVDVRSTVGGGSLPGETLPSWGLAVAPIVGGPDRFLAVLRRGTPAVIGRIEDGRAVFDLRTVDPAMDPTLGAAIAAALSRAGPGTRP